MVADRQSRSTEERGLALFITLIVLALLSAVAAAMVYMSAGEISVAVNQRTYNLAFDAARGGLEEARARLTTRDPSFISSGSQTITFPATPGQILYILNNPGSSFTLSNLTNSSSPYYDWEYDQEWGSGALAAAVSAGTVQTLSSDAISSGLSSLLPQIPYKWVRVTILTEKAANRDINQDGTLNNTIPVYYDAGNSDENLLYTGAQVYRLTSLAILPNGASTMEQYDVGPNSPIPGMPAALTLCGQNPNVNWGPPHSNNWNFNGNDQVGAQPPLDGIATCNSGANSVVTSNLPKPSDYVGKNPTPDVVDDGSDGYNTAGACLQSVTCMDNMVKSLTLIANQVFTYPNVPTTLGTTSNPLITVIQDETSPTYHTGDYSANPCNGAGILVVTGNLTCSGNSTFDGIILVVGQGNFLINGGGGAQFNGAFYVAQTRDSSGNLLSALGTPTFSVNGGGANSMTFNSYYVKQMQNLFIYRALAFRELTHP